MMEFESWHVSRERGGPGCQASPGGHWESRIDAPALDYLLGSLLRSGSRGIHNVGQPP